MTSDPGETPQLTNIEHHALHTLRERGPMTCTMLGEALWCSSKRPGSAPYARPAGKVLRRLLEKKLVTPIFDPERTTRWCAI